MNGVLALVAAAVVGIDIGWEPLPEGGFEYIIQIEPQTLESMKRGQPIGSQLPPAVRGMRAYRIIVGDGAVPHEGEPLPVEAARAPAKEQPKPAGAPGGAAGSTSAAQAIPALPGSDPNAAPAGVAAEAGPSEPADTAAEATPARDSSGVASRAPLRGGSAAQGADQVPAIPAVSGQDEPSGTAPPELEPDPGQKNLREHTASYVQGAQSPGATASGDSGARAGESVATGGETPWLPLVGTVLGLFTSLGANLYLGWSALALRSRYRLLAAQLHAS